MAAATKINPDEWVVAVMSHCNPATPLVVVEEQEFKASDPIVQAAPSMFRPKGTPRSLWPTVFDTAVQRNDDRAREIDDARQADFEARAKANTPTLEPPKLVKAKRDLVCELDGQPATVRKGSQLHESHPVVIENRDVFSA